MSFITTRIFCPTKKSVPRVRNPRNRNIFDTYKPNYPAADIRKCAERFKVRYPRGNYVALFICREHIVKSVLLCRNAAETGNCLSLLCQNVVYLEAYLFVDAAQNGNVFNASSRMPIAASSLGITPLMSPRSTIRLWSLSLYNGACFRESC